MVYENENLCDMRYAFLKSVITDISQDAKIRALSSLGIDYSNLVFGRK